MDSPTAAGKGLLIGAVVLAAVAFIDYLMGAEIGTDTFYLLPVVLVAWLSGLGPALIAAGASAAAWFAVDTLLLGHVYANPAAPYCNALIAFALFAMSSYLVSRLHAALRRETELSRLKSDMLSLATKETLEGTQSSLRQLIQKLLDSGEFALDIASVDAGKIIADALSHARPLISKASLEVAVNLVAPTTLVRADAAALFLVVSTMIDHALKITPAMGRVAVETRLVDGKLELSIQDEGLGIAPDKILAPRDDKRNMIGGLELSEKILKGHGSRLIIDSQPGKGSRFSFRLELAG